MLSAEQGLYSFSQVGDSGLQCVHPQAVINTVQIQLQA